MRAKIPPPTRTTRSTHPPIHDRVALLSHASTADFTGWAICIAAGLRGIEKIGSSPKSFAAFPPFQTIQLLNESGGREKP